MSQVLKNIKTPEEYYREMEEELKYTHIFGQDRYHEINKMTNWLTDNYSNLEGQWQNSYFLGHTKFYFEKKEDLILFKMMWV